MRFNYTNQNSSDIPSGLRSNDITRLKRKEKDDRSMKIQKLYSSSTVIVPPVGPFLGTESSNIIGTQSGVGLGVS